MATLITILYYFLVAFFSLCFLYNFIKSKKWAEELLYLIVLLPFLLRLFRLK
ncbi:MAG TPA: hypothetical protein PKH53_02250 [Candidatus Saccharicenans sp.]|nr:hypothetical protein [Candidatus Saccharicenans sp.]